MNIVTDTGVQFEHKEFLDSTNCIILDIALPHRGILRQMVRPRMVRALKTAFTVSSRGETDFILQKKKHLIIVQQNIQLPAKLRQNYCLIEQ